MKLLFLATFLLLSAVSSPRGETVQPAAQVLHHDLRVELFPEQAQLAGYDVLKVVSPDPARLALRLPPSAQVEAVAVDGQPADFTFKGGRLSVPLSAGQQADSRQVSVNYRISFPGKVPPRPVHDEDPTYGVSATITPGGTFLSGGTWYPHIRGSRSLFRVRVTAPEGVEAVTSGSLLERTTSQGKSVSAWQTAQPLSSLALSAGPYEIRETRGGSIPLYAYFYPGGSELDETYLTAAKDYLALYQGLFGPYPFEKFAVVENFLPTGYGFPSWTLLGSSVVRLPFIVETSLGHEIAHSWWGGAVRPEPGSGNWSEGLTTYVADHLYKERQSTEEARLYRQKILRDYAALVGPHNDMPLQAFRHRDSKASQAIGYGKGAMVFHMLRQKLGETTFWDGLRRLATSRRDETVSWKALISDLAGDWESERFADQWLARSGAPTLALQEVSARPRDGQWEIAGNLIQQGPVYALNVRLQLETAGDSQDIRIASNGRKTPFVLQTPSPPRRLVVDPDIDIFRHLDASELPPTVNGLRGAKNLLVVVAEGVDGDTLSASLELLAAMRRQGAPLIGERKVTSEALRSNDLLFLGKPSTQGLLGGMPDRVADGLAALGEDDALFAALPHPFSGEYRAALFVPAGPEAARKAVRKIPHYGKYSYLVFRGGANIEKATWPIRQSPTIHIFNTEDVP